eukprot:361075-Chlamydomonas_euryale.AAC.1
MLRVLRRDPSDPVIWQEALTGSEVGPRGCADVGRYGVRGLGVALNNVDRCLCGGDLTTSVTCLTALLMLPVFLALRYCVTNPLLTLPTLPTRQQQHDGQPSGEAGATAAVAFSSTLACAQPKHASCPHVR